MRRTKEQIQPKAAASHSHCGLHKRNDGAQDTRMLSSKCAFGYDMAVATDANVQSDVHQSMRRCAAGESSAGIKYRVSGKRLWTCRYEMCSQRPSTTWQTCTQGLFFCRPQAEEDEAIQPFFDRSSMASLMLKIETTMHGFTSYLYFVD
jgi:hypothetical protein